MKDDSKENSNIIQEKILKERLVDIESKVAYQEDLLEALNEIVAKQQLTLDLLLLRFDKVEEYLKSALASNQLAEQSTDDLPPHY
jgi:SlyX protein